MQINRNDQNISATQRLSNRVWRCVYLTQAEADTVRKSPEKSAPLSVLTLITTMTQGTTTSMCYFENLMVWSEVSQHAGSFGDAHSRVKTTQFSIIMQEFPVYTPITYFSPTANFLLQATSPSTSEFSDWPQDCTAWSRAAEKRVSGRPFPLHSGKKRFVRLGRSA